MERIAIATHLSLEMPINILSSGCLVSSDFHIKRMSIRNYIYFLFFLRFSGVSG